MYHLPQYKTTTNEREVDDGLVYKKYLYALVVKGEDTQVSNQ